MTCSGVGLPAAHQRLDAFDRLDMGSQQAAAVEPRAAGGAWSAARGSPAARTTVRQLVPCSRRGAAILKPGKRSYSSGVQAVAQVARSRFEAWRARPPAFPQALEADGRGVEHLLDAVEAFQLAHEIKVAAVVRF